ncbi:MAG: EamA family transporter [Proteobacteria bacterium]|nr:MAG: EamA family transporter [Pseudomonadota bacterium]
MKSRLKQYGADLSLVAVAMAWGLTFLPVQKTIDESPVFLFLFYRFILSTLIIGVFSFKHFKSIDKNSLLGGLILGTFLFLGFGFQTFGLKYTYSSTVAFITGLNVVIVPLFAYLIFRQFPSRYSNLGAIIASVGLYFLSSSELGFGLGELLSLVCAIMFAAQIAFTDFYAKRSNVFLLVFFQLLAVSVLSFIFALLYDKKIILDHYSDTFIYTIFITSIFATVFAFFVQTFMQRFTSPTKTAIIFTLEPVSAGFAGYFYANEILTKMQFFGACLIIFGVLFAEIGSILHGKIKEKNAKR